MTKGRKHFAIKDELQAKKLKFSHYKMGMLLYPAFVLLYWLYPHPVIKALPAVYIALVNRDVSFLFAGIGDYLLATDHVLSGVGSFGVFTLSTFPLIRPSPRAIIPAFVIQPLLFYAFDWDALIIDFYVYSLVNMMSWGLMTDNIVESVGVLLFVISDIFVLAQYCDLHTSWISLPLYWTALGLLATR